MIISLVLTNWADLKDSEESSHPERSIAPTYATGNKIQHESSRVQDPFREHFTRQKRQFLDNYSDARKNEGRYGKLHSWSVTGLK